MSSVVSLRCLAFLSASIAADAAVAETIDCDRLKTSKIPFQVEVEGGKAPGLVQVYRLDGLFKRTVAKSATGKVARTTAQANFSKSVTNPDGVTVGYSYSVPTDVYSFDAGIRDGTMTMTLPSGSVETKIHYDYYDDVDLVVGPCTFKTKHYRFTSTGEGSSTDLEAWFSPELELILKSNTTVAFSGREVKSSAQAKDIRSVFDPFE